MRYFYIGLHQPSDAGHFNRACISINRLRNRRKRIDCPILLDSGAFTELFQYHGYRHEPSEYAREVRRLVNNKVADIEIAVSQDYMCEPVMLNKTSLTVRDHQRLTIKRYGALLKEHLPVPVMPVLQGYHPQEYVDHIDMYGDHLAFDMHVGVGSVCKRNGDPRAIIEVLEAITKAAPWLRLHGFGIKKTSLQNQDIRQLLYSADSMAWSYAGRKKNGKLANDWRYAKSFLDDIENLINKDMESAKCLDSP